jgi:hypothetical protein
MNHKPTQAKEANVHAKPTAAGVGDQIKRPFFASVLRALRKAGTSDCSEGITA